MVFIEGLTLPESTYRKETTQARLSIYIVIDKYGKTEVKGDLLPVKNEVEFLRGFLHEKPYGIPILVIDEDTPMKFVTPMVQLIRKAGYRRHKFSTSNEMINESDT